MRKRYLEPDAAFVLGFPGCGEGREGGRKGEGEGLWERREQELAGQGDNEEEEGQ